MLEGPELVLAALDAHADVDVVYYDADDADNPKARRVLEAAAQRGVATVALAAGALRRASDVVTPQPVVATAAPPTSHAGAVARTGFVLVLCDVADPGNLGTAVRSADAAGCAGVFVCGHGVDVCNPKALRATAGSVFHLPVVVVTLTAAVVALHASGRTVLGAVVRDGPALWSTALTERHGVVVGGEAKGLHEADLELLDGRVTIPMAGRAESLNAGVAASIVCFEALRQRGERASAVQASPTI